jgi:cysteine desulfurase
VIAWDTNAGAPLLPAVAQRLHLSFAQPSGNPSSVHQLGRAARGRLDQAREACARALGAASPREIVFTGSGSEAASIALLGAWLGRGEQAKRRVVTSAIEHPCVLGAVKQLERLGAQVVLVPPSRQGRVNAEAFIAALSPDTLLASLMAVNNETGVVQPASEIARACAARGVLFHCDAVQAPGRIPLSLREIPADLMSLSAHKLGGPAGAGLLYARRAVDLGAPTPGHQENGRRGGTQAVAFAEAMALCLTHATEDQPRFAQQVGAVRDRFERLVVARIEGAQVNGADVERVAGTSSITFRGVDGEALLIALDLEGICVSTGAACASGSLAPSHVLRAMGRSAAEAHGTLRFCPGPSATDAEADQVVAALQRLVPACADATSVQRPTRG